MKYLPLSGGGGRNQYADDGATGASGPGGGNRLSQEYLSVLDVGVHVYGRRSVAAMETDGKFR